jgi:hypothetical protein
MSVLEKTVIVFEISSYCSKKVENFQNFFYSVEKVCLGSKTFSQDHKQVSDVVCERQQITVTSILWLYCEITETERLVDQFSEISKLEVFSTSVYWYLSTGRVNR